MTTTKYYSVTDCAKAIRKDLKQAFPNVKFSVRSSTFSMGNSLDISYSAFIPTKEVNAIVKKYQYGSFNYMTNYYKQDNKKNIPQTKYIIIQKYITNEDFTKYNTIITKY